MEKEYFWFVAIVTPNTELKCETRLDSLVKAWKNKNIIDPSEEVTTFVPVHKDIRIRPSSGKRVKVIKILSTCYVFIRCTESVRYGISCEAKFILHFLMNRASKTTLGKNDFARIPEDQMQNFRLMVEKAQSEIVIDPSRLRVGDKVRIKTGSLEGLECNVYQESDGSTMLALHVDFLGYAKIKCPSDLLSLIKNDD